MIQEVKLNSWVITSGPEGKIVVVIGTAGAFLTVCKHIEPFQNWLKERIIMTKEVSHLNYSFERWWRDNFSWLICQESSHSLRIRTKRISACSLIENTRWIQELDYLWDRNNSGHFRFWHNRFFLSLKKECKESMIKVWLEF